MTDDTTMEEQRQDADEPDEWMTRARMEGLVKESDAYYAGERSDMALADAAYRTMWWEYIHGRGKSKMAETYRSFDNRYETNRIKPAASTFFAQLFGRVMEVEVQAGPSTTGDADKAAMVVNDWMFDEERIKRWDRGVRQGVLYPGVGAKLVLEREAEHLPAHKRVKMRLFPIWEAVLDRDVYDEEDERYRGHVHWRPRSEIAKKYKIPIKELTGHARSDFVAQTSAKQGPTDRGRHSGALQLDAHKATDNNDWVRVLELCNFVDSYCEGEHAYRGRFEVWLLDQGDHSKEPVYVGPMPLMDQDTEPQPHIYVHMFETRSEYPYQGIAPAKQWLPQQAELNAYRSQMADKTSRDRVIWLAPSTLSSDERDKLVSSRDQEVVFIDEKTWREVGGDARRLMVPIQAGALSADFLRYVETVDRDLTATIALSPAAMGVRQDVTAEEIQYQRDFTDSEFGRYAASWERFLKTIARAFLWSVVAIMRPAARAESSDGDDSAAGEESDDTDVTAAPEDVDASVMADPAVLTDVTVKAAPRDDDELTDGQDVDTDDDTKIEMECATATLTITLLNARGEQVEITVDDIDSAFIIGLSDAGRTPQSNAKAKKALAEMLGSYLELWKVANGPDAAAAVGALAGMRAIFEHFGLPRRLHPDVLLAELTKRQAEKPTKAAPDVVTSAAPGPVSAAPAPAGGVNPAVVAALTQIETQFSDVPEVQQAVASIRQLPPDQQGPATQELLAQIQQAQAGVQNA